MNQRVSHTTIEQVKTADSIVTVIQDYVTLHKRGRHFVGLCPFHGERTPSFTVSPEKRLFHCFGCHKSGDAITFVREMDHLSFSEAVVHIANRMGIPVEYEQVSTQQEIEMRERDRVLAMLYEARVFFQGALQKNEIAKVYLTKRHLTEQTLSDFYVGYAPKNASVIAHLQEKGFNDDEMIEGGLAIRTENNQLVSRFRDRIIFPILDPKGRTIGFGGRILENLPNMAKYLNSPETPFFNKSRVLFGLNLAQTAIRKSDYCILMEGYMDVAMAHQFGFSQSIATMGTALTHAHAMLIKRMTSTVFLALDGDEAGQAAAEKSSEILIQAGLVPKIVDLQNVDPADFLSEKGSEMFKNALNGAQHSIEFNLTRLIKRIGLEDIQKTVKVLDLMIPLLKAEKDPVVQKYFTRLISNRLKIDEELVLARLKKIGYSSTHRISIPIKNKIDKYAKAEEFLLYIVASNLEMRDTIAKAITGRDFVTTENGTLFDAIISRSSIGADLLEEVTEIPGSNQLARILIERSQDHLEGLTQEHWKDCIDVLNSHSKQGRINQLKADIKKYEADENESEVNRLLSELRGELI